MINVIIKRNGNKVPFNSQKISDAIAKANAAVCEEVIPPAEILQLTDTIVASVDNTENQDRDQAIVKNDKEVRKNNGES